MSTRIWFIVVGRSERQRPADLQSTAAAADRYVRRRGSQDVRTGPGPRLPDQRGEERVYTPRNQTDGDGRRARRATSLLQRRPSADRDVVLQQSAGQTRPGLPDQRGRAARTEHAGDRRGVPGARGRYMCKAERDRETERERQRERERENDGGLART